MDVDECYQELGLDPGASDADVKAAWRRLAARWHPDRNGSPEALRRIQRINQALEEIRRSRQEMADCAAEAAAPDGADDADDAGGADLAHAIELSVEELATGCVRELRGERVQACADCEGSGRQVQASACPDCGGSGRTQQALWVAWLSSTVACSTCQGLGTTHPACMACGASGQASRPWRGQVRVPPGLRPGEDLEAAVRVQGGRRGERLSVRVRWTLQPHDLFSVADDGTVSCEVPVDGFAWMADRWTDVPTPRGLQQMRLRRGVVNYRIRGAGLPWQQHGAPADCIVTVAPLFPDALGAEQEACIDRLVASNSGAAGTAAAERIARWSARLAGWRARGGRAAG